MRIPALLAHSLLLTTLAATSFSEELNRPADSVPLESSPTMDSEGEALDHQLAGLTYFMQGEYRAASAEFREGLALVTHQRSPKTWAFLHNNLAETCRELGIRVDPEEGNRLLEETVRSCYAASQIFTREHHPVEWAMTQNNLANGLRDQGERKVGTKGAILIEKAVHASRSALEVYSRAAHPKEWARAQNNLGIALRNLGVRQGKGTDGLRLLREAVAAYGSALEVRTLETDPEHWAETKNNLAVTLRNQGERMLGDEGTRLLGDAAQAYRDVLQVRTCETDPQAWAETQNNLGVALRAQGDREQGTVGRRLLLEAVQSYKAALEVRTRKELPQAWATTQNNLGYALETLGDLDSRTPRKQWEAAEKAYLAALEVFVEELMSFHHHIAQEHLKLVQKKLNK